MTGDCQYESRWAAPRARRGVSSLALVLGFALVVSCLALAIDVGLLVQRHQQLKTASEAASLAGALQLFDGLPVTIEHEHRLGEARQLATVFAAENSFNEFRLQLHANPQNDARGDIVAGQIDPLTLGSPFVPAVFRRSDGNPSPGQGNGYGHIHHGNGHGYGHGQGHGHGHSGDDEPPQPINALLVRTRHSQAGGRGPILFFGSMVGVPSHDVYTESIAAVERRIIGYRPFGCTPVPMLPLLCKTDRWEVEDLLDDEQGPGNNGQGLEHGQGHGPNDEHHDGRHNEQHGSDQQGGSSHDKYTYDPRTCVVEAGADGVPEIELVLKKDKGQGNGQGNGNDDNNGHHGEGNNGQGNGNGPEHPGQGQGNGQGNGNQKFKLGKKIDCELVSFAPANGSEHGSEHHHEPGAGPVMQVLVGLTPADLAGLQGQVMRGAQLPLLTGSSPGNSGHGQNSGEVDFEELHAALEQIIGQPRLLLLGSTKGGEQGQRGDVEAFAAGVVVHSLLGEGSITIRIQPVVLNSCTAMPDGTCDPNPWIGKVVLVR